MSSETGFVTLEIKSPSLNISRSARLAIALGSLAALSGCLSSSDSQQADPVVVENPVAYVERALLFDENTGALVEDNLADPSAFRPGARLLLKASATADAETRDIASRAFAGPQFLDDNGQLRYDVKDLHVSHDGSRLLFSMRAPEIEDADDEDQPTWNIWEYDVSTDALRRIIDSDVTARAGQDVAPAYLPDGRIVFSSTRQRISKAVLLDEGKPQYSGLDEEGDSPAFVLHVMDDDGQNIEQITFNQSHDLDPMVADDGTIVFSRWDNAGQTRNNGVNLYRVNPDGTGLSYLFGRHSHDSVPETNDIQYLQPRKSDSGNLLVQLRPFESDDYASVLAEVDVDQFVEANLRTDGTEGSGQRSLVPGVGLDGQLSLKGSYASVSPLLDGTNRYLVSWTPCRLRETATDRIVNCTEDRLQSEEYQPAEPVYGLWLLDITSETQRPVVPPVEGIQFDEAVLMKERSLEGFIPESQFTGDEGALGDAGYGVLHIRSVYDIDGVDTTPAGIAAMADPLQTPPEDRPARFLRLEKPVAIPDENVRDFDNSAFGRSRAQLMREILGYVPIEPDGSVKVAVPANVAFAISVLDEQGQRIGARHQNWLTVRPGETLECSGCHNPNSPTPHGRPDAGPSSVWGGAATTSLPFPNTDQALFADMGETMAQVFARINEIRRPTPDVIYADEWSGDAVDPKPESFAYAYADLQTPPPVSGVCATDWAPNCRIVINYEQHIHPLWGLNREVLDPNTMTVVDDYTCTSCHTDTDAADAQQVPAGQLDLGDGPSPDEPLHFNAYRELLFPDNKQEVVNGALVDELEDSGEILRDEEGNPILDANGDEQPIFVTIPVPASMSVNGARASDFFDVFAEGGTHRDFLTPAELRLIAEWLDIGGQYFNNPFDAPED
ncbi:MULTISPECIES: PD40 domain-containing protein [unclassified Marinobacter]|uniref:HzsA-related protein n=1 Tax=unclassified Marinobacter TaxID=83889 RepID=UPI001927D19D|nr:MULTISPECIES: PD40 domain-containing protein [unclassified Marinobacter]MBL3825346.1 PD40 domain-containing protein [Marinobacter sp. MC3]MBL3893852.1 PD40 domain-containing protein [Marinobacter sp. MW3]